MAIPPVPPLNPSGTALFLDVDGTLAPFERQPDHVGPDQRRTAILRRLGARLGGRLAVISGRPIADLDRILQSSVRSAAGVHGLERRGPDGSLSVATPHPAVAMATQAFADLAAQRPGLLLEPKGLSVALHYRNAPQEAAAVLDAGDRLARDTGLVLQRGEMVVELRTPGQDKGDALRALMAEPPFVGCRPVFVGDDLTDEAGFRAAAALGGYGVLVGAPRDTAARYALADVGAVLDWLEAAALAPDHGVPAQAGAREVS